MTSRDSDGRAESGVFSSKPSNFSMGAKQIKISPDAAGNFTLTAPGLADITFDQAELDMMKKGTIPSGILTPATSTGISAEQLIRAAMDVEENTPETEPDDETTMKNFLMDFELECKAKGIIRVKDQLEELSKLDIPHEKRKTFSIIPLDPG